LKPTATPACVASSLQTCTFSILLNNSMGELLVSLVNFLFRLACMVRDEFISNTTKPYTDITADTVSTCNIGKWRRDEFHYEIAHCGLLASRTSYRRVRLYSISHACVYITIKVESTNNKCWINNTKSVDLCREVITADDRRCHRYFTLTTSCIIGIWPSTSCF
jgi:hypothetical protein